MQSFRILIAILKPKKYFQLENMASAIVKVADKGSIIVDFCSGNLLNLLKVAIGQILNLLILLFRWRSSWNFTCLLNA